VKAQEVRDFLATNSAKINELKANIDRGAIAVSRRTEADWQRHEEACALFHKSYDALAFPGGLGHAMTLLKSGDASMAEAALIYCEIRPYYFRSGYHRSKFLRLLGQIPLPTHLESRLKAVKEEVHRRKLESRRQPNEYWRVRPSQAEADRKKE
jgi:hypothetical protein